ncbi:hypothetical protein [Stakelama tenebrarum]|uniref:Uncharacterized protein n=1 Tax=Stakelama tenebrarum TaxID=2711215 RepID=A0A6G6Y5B3_9SPHN|nr:hypothetical protein [Sphingosinithalassobacter tenebrarum]QIG80122.1 hypothetical protein G5C33_10240 [Sphingosinithalassobacter tenebrarum]
MARVPSKLVPGGAFKVVGADDVAESDTRKFQQVGAVYDAELSGATGRETTAEGVDIAIYRPDRVEMPQPVQLSGGRWRGPGVIDRPGAVYDADLLGLPEPVLIDSAGRMQDPAPERRGQRFDAELAGVLNPVLDDRGRMQAAEVWQEDGPVSAITIIADSFGEDASGLGIELPARLPGMLAYKNAIGGQRIGQLAMRLALKPVTGVFAGDQVAGSGATAVTGLYILDGAANRTIAAMTYSTDGTPILGRLSFTGGAATYAFTPAHAGTTWDVPNPAVIEPLTGVCGTPLHYLRRTVGVIIGGRNDVGKTGAATNGGAYDFAQVMDDARALAGFFDGGRSVIIGVANGVVDKAEADGGSAGIDAAGSETRLRQVAQINAGLRAGLYDRLIDTMGLAEAFGATAAYAPQSTAFQVIVPDWTIDGDGLHPGPAIGAAANPLSGKPMLADAGAALLFAKGYF